MENSFETLKTLGAQRIYETTHIAKLTIEHILNKKFDALNPVQFSGFISILEREYSIDLSELRKEFSENTIEPEAELTTVAFTPAKNRTKQYLLIALASLVVVALFFIATADINDTNNTDIEINNTALDQVKDKIQEPLLTSNETVVTDEEIKNIESVKEPILPSKLLIKPRSKLWIGLVNLTNFKKSQKITKDEIELNGDDAWLIVLGHGNVDFKLGDEIIKQTDTKKLRFLYENGVLEKISKTEFKNRNRGKNW